MHLTHIIIDDFFPDPMAVRQGALSLPYPPKPEAASYPGRNAARPLRLPDVEQVVSALVHEPLKPAAHGSHAVPRLALEGDQSKASVHADFCHWSGIVFLSLDEHCEGGTHFFRHKETGWDRAPVFPGEPEEKGFANADEAMQHVLAGQNDRSKWDETFMLPMRFNRLVLFRGYLWHDAGNSFGSEPENGRLILPLFFENTDPTG